MEKVLTNKKVLVALAGLVVAVVLAISPEAGEVACKLAAGVGAELQVCAE